MTFACFCAICGVGIDRMLVRTPPMRKLRRRVIVRRGDDGVDRRSDSEEADSDSDSDSEEKASQDEDENEERRVTVNEDPDHPRANDLYLVDEDGICWVSTEHCLVPTGIESKVAVSGPGDGYGHNIDVSMTQAEVYLDFTMMWGVVIGAQVENSNCYQDGEDRYAGPAFPRHPDCYMILSFALTGLGAHKIDLEVLYHTMVEMIRADGKALDLDYGVDVIRGQEDYGKCILGTEYCVTQPAINSKLVGYIEDGTRYCEFDCPFPNPNRQTRVRHDSFGRFPVEIAHSICPYLSGDSMKALLQASFEVSVATHHNSFWKLFIKSDMPWFWEIHRLVKNDKLPGYLNYKGFHLWLDHVSTPKFGKADNFLGVANRRRIWGLFQEVKI